LWKFRKILKFTVNSQARRPLKSTTGIFWDVKPCSLVEVYWRFFAEHILAACLVYSSTLKMEAVLSSEISVNFYHVIRRHIPEDSTLGNHNRENLKSHTEDCAWLFNTRFAANRSSLQAVSSSRYPVTPCDATEPLTFRSNSSIFLLYLTYNNEEFLYCFNIFRLRLNVRSPVACGQFCPLFQKEGLVQKADESNPFVPKEWPWGQFAGEREKLANGEDDTII
jgi:hypothetical protein